MSKYKLKKRIALLIILITFVITVSFDNLSAAKKNTDLFNDILVATDSDTTEYGITSTFNTKNNDEDIANYILKDFGFLRSFNKKELKDGKGYSIEFGDNYVNGYIETIKYEDYNVVTVNIVKKDSKNNLEGLKNKLQKCLKYAKVDAKYFEYLKAKSTNAHIEEINNQVLALLKDYRAVNINTISLENGYSTVAYTKNYDSIQSDNKIIDFNCAVCKYSSGSYVIIGTPELIVTY